MPAPTPITAITASKSVGLDMDWISITCGANLAGKFNEMNTYLGEKKIKVREIITQVFH